MISLIWSCSLLRLAEDSKHIASNHYIKLKLSTKGSGNYRAFFEIDAKMHVQALTYHTWFTAFSVSIMSFNMPLSLSTQYPFVVFND